jgi:hypothetical protein
MPPRQNQANRPRIRNALLLHLSWTPRPLCHLFEPTENRLTLR